MAELNKDDCTIGMSEDDEVCIITLPLRKYALDEDNGNALIYGKLRELQAHVMQMALAIRKKRNQAGILKVNGTHPPDLTVN